MAVDAIPASELGTQTLLRSFVPTAETYFRTYSPHRLCYQATWIWSQVEDADGQRYSVMREVKTEYSNLALVGRLNRDPAADPDRVYRDLYLGIIEHNVNEEAGRVELRSFPGGRGFTATIEPQHYHLVEAGGDIELDFRALGPAMEYYCPGAEDALYASELCRVEGTFQGRPVSGYGGLDLAWGPPGIGWTQGKIYGRLERYWIVWVNRADDGTHEYGVAVAGEEGFEVGFRVRSGQVHLGRCRVEMEHDAGGFPRQAQAEVSGEPYTFTTTSRVSAIKGRVLWASGEMRARSEPRPVEHRFAWLEYFAHIGGGKKR